MTIREAKSSFTHLLTSRRLREVSNSMYHHFPEIRRRLRYNPAFLHSLDLADLGLVEGDRSAISSDHGRIEAIVQSDDALRPGVLSTAHSWGGLPQDNAPYEEVGSYTGLLISTDRDRDPINAMPRQSAIPIRIERIPTAGADRCASAARSMS